MKVICLQAYEDYENEFDSFLRELGFFIILRREKWNPIIQKAMKRKKRIAIKFYSEDLGELREKVRGFVTYILCVK